MQKNRRREQVFIAEYGGFLVTFYSDIRLSARDEELNFIRMSLDKDR